MVITQSGTDVPFAQINLVLDERGLFEVPFFSVELKRRRGAVVELAGIGDDVTELFMDIGGIGLKTRLPFISPLVNRERSL